MAQFTLVINEVSGEELEKIIGIQVKSGNKLTFVPQGLQGQQTGAVVLSPTMAKGTVNVGNPPKSTIVYNNVRIEWNMDAAQFATELFALFTREERSQERKAG